MKVLIIEADMVAFDKLVNTLATIDPLIEVMGTTEGVAQTLRWLQHNALPDLIFMDVFFHDGSAFDLLSQIEDVPVIFTTTSRQYAIKAFKVNCVDYLLKPLQQEMVVNALMKFQKRKSCHCAMDMKNQGHEHANKFNRVILVSCDKDLLPVSVDEVAYFYNTDSATTLAMKNGTHYLLGTRLKEVFSLLDPLKFMRVNRQFVVGRKSVRDITMLVDGRMKVNLNVSSPEKIIVSRSLTSDFKRWLVQDK